MQNENPNLVPPSPQPDQPAPVAPIEPPLPDRNRWKWASAIAIVIIFLGIDGYIAWHHYHKTPVKSTPPAASTQTPAATTETTAVQGLQLDSNKNYGNKYAGGLLPVGDSKYVSDAAKIGYVYVCSGYAANLKSAQGGAGSRGPWFTNNNTQYDINKKLHVQGSVTWQASFSNKIAGSTRTILTNDLPNHTTGVFPISSTDPAYAYDRNPNHITGQTLTYNLNASPTYGSPNCMGGEAGIMLTGVALFNAFDAGGRDAGAWEIQDSCGGHPQKEGEYHYHTLSSCIKDTSVKTVIGFALNGFPITGPQVSTNNILTTANLDECHGLTSQIVLDGQNVTMYHYVMTQDFPYSISCFRGTAIQPPGQPTPLN
jgi:hypothetical protein